jgi:peroxiredoxin
MKNFVPILLVISVVSPLAAQSRRAPGFSLPDVTQKQHDLADYRGKVVLLDVMRTSCPHCEELTGTLEKVKTKYGPKIQILSIVMPPDNLTTVKKYMADHKMTTPVLFDCGQVAASYVQATAANPRVNLPQLFVIDKNGTIRQQLTEEKEGALSEKSISAAVDAGLK